MSILVEPARIITVTLPDLIADYSLSNPVVVEIVSFAPPICKVRRLGEVEVFSGLTPGATYWVSAAVAGAITAIPPGFPSILNEIGIAITPKKLAIEPTRLIIKN